jgi:hypothetical protein
VSACPGEADGLYRGHVGELVTAGTGVTSAADADTALRGIGLRPSRWSVGPRTYFAAHTHAAHKVLFCVAGSIDFLVSGRRWPMGPGDRLDLPAGTSHEAEAGPGGVTCVEAFRD